MIAVRYAGCRSSSCTRALPEVQLASAHTHCSDERRAVVTTRRCEVPAYLPRRGELPPVGHEAVLFSGQPDSTGLRVVTTLTLATLVATLNRRDGSVPFSSLLPQTISGVRGTRSFPLPAEVGCSHLPQLAACARVRALACASLHVGRLAAPCEAFGLLDKCVCSGAYAGACASSFFRYMWLETF